MAANNYFGFTHGGTQYKSSSIVLTPQPTASAYPAAAAQTAYVQPAVAAQPTAYATAAPQVAQTYATYPATHTAGQYAYAAARPQATATYDASKAYYAPAAAAPAASATAVYTVAETPYQTTAKPVYATTSYATQVQPRQAVAAKPVQSSTSYTVYPTSAGSSVATASSAAANTYNPTTTTQSYSSGYDAALYSAATTYYQQQQAAKSGTTWQYKKTATGASLKPKAKPPPKAPQLHYCDVCKISCAGSQTYKEHLEGQKHKKKETASKALQEGKSTSTPRTQHQLRCELCDVACTGNDAYAAHVRGAKHEKVLKLHQRLGKPIPSTDPVVVPNVTATKAVSTTAAAAKNGSTATAATKKVVAATKITFVGGNTLKSTGSKLTETKTEVKAESDADSSDADLLSGGDDVIPVGQEYIEEMKNESGKVVSFNCKLCDCKFNDPNAKEMHMKGRKHRLQYKKKVDPTLPVEVKPSIRARKLQEDKLRRQAAKEDYWRSEHHWQAEMWHRMEQEASYMYNFRPGFGGPGFGGPGFGRMPPFMPHMDMRRPATVDDRHVLAKHSQIYPVEEEHRAVQNMVTSCEKALKLVCDYIAEVDAPIQIKTEKKDVKKAAVAKTADKKEGEEEKEEDGADAPPRAIKGLLRIGVLAKGLLLHDDLNVEMVLLCNDKPTRTLLVRIADNLPKQLCVVIEEKLKELKELAEKEKEEKTEATPLPAQERYVVRICVEEAAIIITSQNEPKVVCKVTLTSPVVREAAGQGETTTPVTRDPPDVLDKEKCLLALAELRHAKWFQARAAGLPSCVFVIRVLRDLCQRVPTWTPLPAWGMELLVEKCIATGGPNLGPGDAMRRVFESIAAGVLLPGGPGLYDPCEKDAVDCSAPMTAQEREDITASAQHALRLIAFRQIYKVLGMEALPPPRFHPRGRPPFNPRKRQHSSTDEGQGDTADTGKLVKKEDQAK